MDEDLKVWYSMVHKLCWRAKVDSSFDIVTSWGWIIGSIDQAPPAWHCAIFGRGDTGWCWVRTCMNSANTSFHDWTSTTELSEP